MARINWLREYEMWSVAKIPTEIMFQLTDRPHLNGHLICSFNYAVENCDMLKQLGFEVLIVDEAHLLKSHEADRSKKILGAAGIIRSATIKRCWLLSGTPAPNDASELWIMLYTFGVTDLKFDAFINKFCIVRPTTYGLKVVSSKARPDFRTAKTFIQDNASKIKEGRDERTSTD